MDAEQRYRVRHATLADAAAIASIYNQGIAERIATFEAEPRSVAQIEHDLAEKGSELPTIVVEDLGRVVAWAGAGRYRNRACYAGVVEHSVYVDQACRNAGAGRVALQALVDTYARLGFWKIVSRIFPENLASLALHARVGFCVVGTYRRHGKLGNEWRDCVIVERLLGDDAQQHSHASANS
jgi:phosphinothricin acetyltransferase